MRTALAVAVLAALALVLLNPSMDDFKVFVESRSEQLLLNETGDSAFGRALSSIGSSLAGTFVDRVTTRNTYGLFSTYTVDLDGPDEAGEEWRFVGIGGRFLEIDRPESMEKDAGHE